MNARRTFLKTLVPILAQLSRSPDPALAAEAAEEHARRARELADLSLPSPASFRCGADGCDGPTRGGGGMSGDQPVVLTIQGPVKVYACQVGQKLGLDPAAMRRAAGMCWVLMTGKKPVETEVGV